MKYRTQTQRLQAVIDAYTTHVKTGPFTIAELAQWAEANKLYPAPGRGDPPEWCDAWEAQLEKAIDQTKA